MNHTYIFSPNKHFEEESLQDLISQDHHIQIETNYAGTIQFTESHYNLFIQFLNMFVPIALKFTGMNIQTLTETYFDWLESGHGPLCVGTTHFIYDTDYFLKINWIQRIFTDAWINSSKSVPNDSQSSVASCIAFSIRLSNASMLFASLPRYVVQTFNPGNK